MKDPIKTGASMQSFDDVDMKLKAIAEADTFIAQSEAKMNEEINKIKERYDLLTKEQRGLKQILEQEVEGFCKMNKEKFEESKTKQLVFGKVFFRTSPPKVTQLNKKYTVATTLELAKKLFKKKFIREKEELDKEEVLASYAAKEIDDQKLAAIGLKIDQDEKFGYEINWEALENEK